MGRKTETAWARVSHVTPYSGGRLAKLYLKMPDGVSAASTWSGDYGLPFPKKGDLVRVRCSGQYKGNALLGVADLVQRDGGTEVHVFGTYEKRRRQDIANALRHWNVYQPGQGDELTLIRGGRGILHGFVHHRRHQCEGDAEREESEMSMSRDRVRFRLTENMLTHSKMPEVLRRAFGVTADEVRRLREGRRGVVIVCRPSQFARFLIYRNEAGIHNQFLALGPPELLDADSCVPETADPYSWVANEARGTSVGAADVQRILEAVGIGEDYVRERMCERGDLPGILDVSDNPHRG